MRLVSLFPPAKIDVAGLVVQTGFAQPNRRAKTIAGFCSVQFEVGHAGLG
jgi:hypothetical protein